MSKNKDYNILVVDDEVEYQNVLAIILEANGYVVHRASSGMEALSVIADTEISLVLTDLKMPGMSGIELIGEIKKSNPDIYIIVVTAYGTIESAVEAIKYGASSYFVKSNDPEMLLIDVNRLAEINRLTRENNILKEQTVSDSLFLGTKNDDFKNVLDMCKKAAKSNINILILGESGVGKEVIANYIHKESDRRDNHFIPFNCQSFGDGTIESELFGHEKGAFTGAISKRIGRFEEANFGTIFLDEIGDLPMQTQGKLLRALENRTIERMGSNKSIELDIRLISATNKDLNEEIERGSFREDLLYRINTLTINVPPLRERREDVPDLITYFLSKIQKEQKKQIKFISDDVMSYLLNYDYPGNIRELKNILERLVVLSEDGVIKGSLKSDCEPLDESLGKNIFLGLREARSNFEAEYIARALQFNDRNVNKTARMLKITSRQLWNKISEYNL